MMKLLTRIMWIWSSLVVICNAILIYKFLYSNFSENRKITIVMINIVLHTGCCRWATPCEKLHIQTFKPKSSKVEANYHLQVYERNIQVGRAWMLCYLEEN